MHHLEGQSSWFDHIRRVMLSHAIELEVTQDRARLLIGGQGGAPKREIVFTRPAVVSSMGIVAQVIEEEGRLGPALPDPAPTQWIVCPTCLGAGGGFDAHEAWHDCPECGSAGLVPLG